MTQAEADRRNRGQAAFRAWAARMGHATDHWLLMTDTETEAWCAAGDAALGYGYQPPAFAAGTCCAGAVGGAGAAGVGVPFVVGGGGGAGGAVGSGVWPR